MVLVILRSLMGFSMSMHLPVAQACLGDMTPEGQEGRWMGYFNAVLFGGIGAGPLVGGVLNDWFGFHAVFLISSSAMLASFLLTLIYLPNDPPRQQQGQHGMRQSLGLLRRSPVVRSVVALQAGNGLMTGISMAFLPVLAVSRLGLSTTLIGIILAMRTPVSMLQSFSGSYADTHNRKVQMTVGSLIAALSLVLVIVAANFWTLVVAYSLLAFGGVLMQPASSAYMLEAGRSHGMGAMMAMSIMSMQVGASIGPIAIGRMIDGFGVNAGFALGAALNLLGLAYFLWGMRHTSGMKVRTGL